VPTVPVGLMGTRGILPSLFSGSRGVVTIRIGEPFELPPYPFMSRPNRQRRHTDIIMERIARLLPPHMRGAYAESAKERSDTPHPEPRHGVDTKKKATQEVCDPSVLVRPR
jgi:1-acyl-sn-glycerol-3-phosphate acyltransferase